MAGNVKFELSAVSPEDSVFSGSYPIGQQGNYRGPNLDRSGSFRERSDGRSFSSGTSTSKSKSTVVADFLPLSKCLFLEPISMGDLRYTLEGKLRRLLGSSLGGNSEDNYLGAAQSKPSPTLTLVELKRFRAIVHEGCQKARIRMKRWDELLTRLNKFYGALIPKNQQTNERSGGPNLLKMGTQSRRSSLDLAAQKFEERNKNIGVNKRARTPVGDLRAEGRSNGLQKQHLALEKDKDTAKDGSSDLVEENILRFPSGGEGWDKNMKRKRSVSNVIPRPVDGDGELKRTMHSRLGNDCVIQASESIGFRSGSSNSANGIHKLDGASSTSSLSARMAPKNELEKPPLSRELTEINKERLPQRGNSTLNMREDAHLFSGSSVTKGKSSRVHRTLPGVGNSSPSFPRLSRTIEDQEQPLNVNKAHSFAGVNNRKRPLPTESSSTPMAQWVVQRPQKISRNRRKNILSPTSNHDEAQVSSEGSDLNTRLSGGIDGSHPVRNLTSSSQQLKAKFENAQENCAMEHVLNDKILNRPETDEKSINGHEQFGLFTKKSKLVVKEEIGEAVHKQGRTGRGSSFSRGGMSPLREKPESPAIAKPVRSTRPGSEKNGSKSGRPPLKNQSNRKGFTRLGALPNSSSDCTGGSVGDREELLAAAQFACNASYNGCSSMFWKRMEPVFYIRLEDKPFLQEQLKPVEEHKPIFSEVPSLHDNIVNHGLRIEDCQPQRFVSEESKKFILDNGLMESAKTRVQETNSSCRVLDTRKEANGLTPLYQKVLSALIVEDEFEELEENSFGKAAASLAKENDPLAVVNRFYSNGNITHSRISSIPVHEEFQGDEYGSVQPVCQAGPEAFQHDANGSIAISINAYGDSSLECQYDQMCLDERLLLELQSFGIYPERVAVPVEGEDELINEDIVQFKKQLGQQGGNKKAYLDRIQNSIREKHGFEGRELEQVAMDQLTELSFKKLLATRGVSAARIGVSKVSRHVALTCVRRTLARCRKFEDTGKSCFSAPALRDVLFAAPNNFGCVSQAEQNLLSDSRTSGSYRGSFDAHEPSDHTFAKNGPILNRGKKKEVLLDDFGANASMRSTSTLCGNAKGKRSERDSGSKPGRPSTTTVRGERKTKPKPKPKQKASQTSTHPVQPVTLNIQHEGLIPTGNILDSSKDSKDSLDLGGLPLHELDSIGVANEFVGNEDLCSWLNFDEDGLQDIDSMGLEIPMDDLSELNMMM